MTDSPVKGTSNWLTPGVVLVDINYQHEMVAALVRGDKICTTRARRYGNPGDFLIFEHKAGRVQVIISMQLMSQMRTRHGLIAKHLYKQEGFESEDALIEFSTDLKNAIRKRWKMPPAPFNPDKMVWLHWFGDGNIPPRIIKKLKTPGYRLRLFTVQKKLEVI